MYHVIGGKYEEFNGEIVPSCKYSAEFDNFEEAWAQYKVVKSYTWAAIEGPGGELIAGYNACA